MIDRIRRRRIWTCIEATALGLAVSLILFFGPAGGMARLQRILSGEIGDSEFLALTIYVGIFAVDAVGLYLLFQYWATSSLRLMQEWCRSQPNPEEAEEELNDLYEYTSPKFKLRINDKLLLYDDEKSSFIAKTDDIFWIYPAKAQDNEKGSEGKNQICLRYASDADQTSQITVDGGEESMQRVLSYLQTQIPDALFGYSDELDSIYRDSYGLQGNAFGK